MSVVKIQRTKSVGAATVYAVYGTYENMRNDVVRAAAYSVVSATPDATPMQFVHDTVAEIARHPQRTNQAEIEIQSFHPDELSADDPFDIQLAHLAGLELARRLAPNTDVVVATHTDSKSGHLHNHIIYANHDRVTGTTPRNVRNFHKVKHINDEVMKDLGLEVYAPEVPPGPGGGLSVLRGKALPEITKDNWREEMTQRVDAVLADPRVAAASTVSDGLEVAQNIASEYNVSFRVTTHEKENRDDVTATSYALVDDDGEMIRYSTSRGSRSTERTGSRLGRDAYTYEVVNQRIEDLQRQYQQQLNQQQQIRTLQELNHAEEAQEEHSEPEPTTVQAGGTFGIGGTESLTDKYADILTDAGTTADTGAEPAAAAPGAAEEEERTDAVHGDGTRRTVHAVGEGRDGGSPRPDERSLPGRREREHQAAVSSSGSVVQPESARQDAAAEPTTSGRSQAAPWSPDDSVEDMRQVDLDFLEQRVMNDEFRQFQRSEFAGTDAEYFAHLLDDDSAVAEDHENYAHARTRLFNPVGDRREYFLRSVGENRRRAAAIQRQRQQRQNQQQRQKYAPDF
ncbi:relaxase/mobilization nuclease domain-containing protein [Corynebacterium sp. HMSC059E07]|uniref:relaxase/mobilization nuclease domain-containing protein n=1 Tax=Corynebacterium sp. HMSC059E07 TaxID=1739471 RepID=UPI0008A2704F|nr:relaxase/mobilization nuclease domain-containing protein [Corynebacterium sp. HMSC059E07]